MRTNPTVAEKAKLVALLAKYINTDGGPIKVQERVYSSWMNYLEQLEQKYPLISFRSCETQASLVSAAKRKAAGKLFRGAGSTF